MLLKARLKVLLSLALTLSMVEGVAYCKTIKDIDIPEQITQPGSQQVLLLNGAGIRSKFFVSVYIGALYLKQKQHTASAILQDTGPRRVMMYCLYSEISKDKLVDAWNEGFTANSDEATLASLRDRLHELNRLFPAMHKGDTVYLDYIPAQGTQITFNDKVLGVIPGADFNIALLKVWLGESPADSNLKEAMLGEE
jgi:hypothetical protein